MKINKGDKFLCIKDVTMWFTEEVVYNQGNVYISEQDGCITNNKGNTSHCWAGVEDVLSYFKPLRFVDRMYTEATDRLRELHRNFTGEKLGDPDEADQFDNKGIDHECFAFSAQVACEEAYKEDGYDYVSEEVFIELNGLEEKTNNIKDYEGYIGRHVRGFKFDSQHNCGYMSNMDDYIGVVGTIAKWDSDYNTFKVKFKDDFWFYPADLVIKQLEQKEIYDEDPYSWVNNGIREAESREEVRDFKSITDSIADLLEYKNTKYGNAVLEPLQIFSGKCKAGTRLDDKLGRIKNSSELRKNDVADLIGYLILTCKENNWTDFSEFKD